MKIALVIVAASMCPSGALAGFQLSESQNKAPVQIDSKDAEKKFGALSSLIGTKWAINGEELVDVNWDQPGQGIIISRSGLYGSTTTFVVPDQIGKTLKYVRLSDDTGLTLSSIASMPRPGVFLLRATPKMQERCRKSKAEYLCEKVAQRQGKWVVDPDLFTIADGSFPLLPVAKDEAIKIRSGMGAVVFPDRFEESYDPRLGMLSFAMGRTWFSDLPAESNANGELMFEAATREGKLFIATARPDVPIFAGTSSTLVFEDLSGVMSSTYVYPWNLSLQSATIRLKVQEGGAAVICLNQMGNQFCSETRISLDGSRLLQRYFYYRYGQKELARAQFYNPDIILHNGRADDISLYASKFGKSYSDDRGRFFRIASSISQSSDRHTYLNAFEPTGSGSKESFSRGSLKDDIDISSDGNVRLKKSGLPLTEITPFQFMASHFFGWQDKIRRSHAAIQEIERRDRQEFWNGFARSAASMSASGGSSSNAWQGSSAADWQARLPSGGGVTGMGGSLRTQAPRMTAQEQAKWNEIERFKIREQLYRGEKPTTIEQDARTKTTRQLEEKGIRDRKKATEEQALAAEDNIKTEKEAKRFADQVRPVAAAQTPPAKSDDVRGMCTFPAYVRNDSWSGVTVEEARSKLISAQGKACSSDGNINNRSGSLMRAISCKPPVVTKFSGGSQSTLATCSASYQCPSYEGTCKASGGKQGKATAQ